jgi:malate synthase
VWQWLRHGAKTDTGKTITVDLVRETIASQAKKLGSHPNVDKAASLLDQLTTSPDFADFMPLVAYEYV